MNNISTEQLEQKIEAGEEVIDRYFDATTTRLGIPHVMTSRRQPSNITAPISLPDPMVNELDKMADELNISRQAVINMMLRRALDEHYLARKIAS